ncbi:MAG: bacteriohemerythrin [Desulfopila sp.]
MQKNIRWHESLAVGNELIDAQHKILFDLANDLNNAVYAGSTKRVVDTLFSVIMDYAFKHFADEERLLKDNANLQAHCYEHYQLLRRLHEYSVKYRNGRSVVQEPAEFMKEWLTSHIQSYDMLSLATVDKDVLVVEAIDSIDDFDHQDTERRLYKRVRYEDLVDEAVVGHCYNTSTMKSGKVNVVDFSGGGLRIFARQKIDIGDLLIISCRVGKTFKMKEKVRVKSCREKNYGVEFVAPDAETVRFLTQICGAVRLTREH